MSQKYVIVHFVELPKVPHEFLNTRWPLHVTLLPNFTIIQPLKKLINELESYSQQAEPFEIMADGEALFGPGRDIRVSLIRPSESIRIVHKNLLNITVALGGEYDEPRYIGQGFRPHATIQAEYRVTEGQPILLNSFTLVDMYPNEDIERRKILKTFELLQV